MWNETDYCGMDRNEVEWSGMEWNRNQRGNSNRSVSMWYLNRTMTRTGGLDEEIEMFVDDDHHPPRNRSRSRFVPCLSILSCILILVRIVACPLVTRYSQPSIPFKFSRGIHYALCRMPPDVIDYLYLSVGRSNFVCQLLRIVYRNRSQHGFRVSYVQ